MHRFNEITFGILPALLNTRMTTPGLFYDTVYDTSAVPLMPGAIGEVQVNTSTYDVECGLIQNITLDDAHFNATAGGWCLDPSETLLFSGCISIGMSLLQFIFLRLQ